MFAADLRTVARRTCADSRIKPADRRVVVVSSCVGDRVVDVIVRQIVIFSYRRRTRTAKSAFGKPKTVAQFFDIRRNHAQIFRPKRQIADGVFQRFKQLFARNIHPLTVDRRRVAAGNFHAAAKPRNGQRARCQPV